METRPLSIIAVALDHAKAQGAVGAEGYLATWLGRRVESDGGRPRVFPDNGTRVVGRVYVEGGGTGTWSTTSAEPVALRAAVEDAMDQAWASPKDPFAGPAERYDHDLSGHGLDDPRHDSVSDDDRIEVVRDNLESVRTDGVRAVSCDYGDRRTVHAFASSRGVSSAYRETSYRLNVVGESNKGQWRTARTERGRAFATVGSLPFGVGVSRRIEAFVREVGLPSQEYSICLPPRVMAVILAGLAPGFEAAALAAGRSWAAPPGPLASHRIHLIDDGSVPGSPRTLAFDERGVPPMPMPVIREGAPAGRYHSPETARLDGVRPTGHVVNGAVRRSNLILRAGNRSRTQMLGELPWAVLLDRLEGSIDPVTGQLDAFGPAHVLERGKRVGYLPSFRLVGDARKLLLSVAEISSDQERHVDVDCATTVIQGFQL